VRYPAQPTHLPAVRLTRDVLGLPRNVNILNRNLSPRGTHIGLLAGIPSAKGVDLYEKTKGVRE
jgi:hypothetical protein